MGDFGDEWVVRVGVGEHGADGEEDLEVLAEVRNVREGRNTL